MKRLFFLLICFLLTPVFFSLKAEKRALIVAIGNYEKTQNGYLNIGSLNDVPLIDTILRQSQFNDITILRDSQATKLGIIKSIQDLINRTQKGDVLVLHFSCHGVLIMDENGGYAEEALVAWDSPFHIQDGYKGENHITYSEIRNLRDGLRAKAGAGGDVLFIFDACHSGGMTRGNERVRGGETIKIRGWKTNNQQRISGQPDEASYLGYVDNNNANWASYEAISACKSEEVNTEYKLDSKSTCGSLSLAFSKALLKSYRKVENYTQLYTAILDEMYGISPNQHPVMTGTFNSRGIFGGQLIPVEAHFSILKKKSENSDLYVIDGGLLKGLTKGSILEAYPAGLQSIKDRKPLFKVKVKGDPNMLSSNIELIDTAISNLRFTSFWLYVKEIAFNGEQIKFSTDSLYKHQELVTQLKLDFAKDSEIVIDNKNPHLFIKFDDTKNAYIVYNHRDGKRMVAVPASSDDLKEYLVRYAQFLALKKIELNNTQFAIRCYLKNLNGSEIETKLGIKKILRDGDRVKIGFKNESSDKKQVFINVFDFQPNGVYSLPIKDKQVAFSDSLEISIDVTEPFGEEMLMAISSPQPLSLESFMGLNRSTGIKGGGLSKLQDIFGRPTQSNSRGVSPFDDDGYTTNLYFTISK